MLGSRAAYLLNNAGDPAAALQQSKYVQALSPHHDGVFFNAGFGRFQSLDAVTAEDFDALFAVNVAARSCRQRHWRRSFGMAVQHY